LDLSLKQFHLAFLLIGRAVKAIVILAWERGTPTARQTPRRPCSAGCPPDAGQAAKTCPQEASGGAAERCGRPLRANQHCRCQQRTANIFTATIGIGKRLTCADNCGLLGTAE